MRKTYVMFTIDAEAQLYMEHAFWSYHVNGLQPHDLPQMIEHGIVEQSAYGSRLAFVDYGSKLKRDDLCRRMRELRGSSFDSFDPSKTSPEDMMTNATGGLPSIFRSLNKYGFKSTAFVDFSGLYTFGAQDFGETIALMEHFGHDAQVHLHIQGGVNTDAWFAAIGAIRPGNSMIETWDADTVDRIFARVSADYEKFLGRGPLAYRGGAYRISENILRALAKYGFRLDFSLDHQEKSASKQLLAPNLRFGDYPLHISGLCEVPVTAFRVDPTERPEIDRFRVSLNRQNRRFRILENIREDGPPVITYILHSPSLMRKVDHPERQNHGKKIVLREDEDPELVKIFEAELDVIANQDHLEVVTARQLAERVDEIRDDCLSTGRYFFQDITATPRLDGPHDEQGKRRPLKGRACNLCGAGDREAAAGGTAAGRLQTGACANCSSTARDRTFKIFFDAVLKPDVFASGALDAAVLVNARGTERRLLKQVFANTQSRRGSRGAHANAWHVISAPEERSELAADFVLLKSTAPTRRAADRCVAIHLPGIAARRNPLLSRRR